MFVELYVYRFLIKKLTKYFVKLSLSRYVLWKVQLKLLACYIVSV